MKKQSLKLIQNEKGILTLDFLFSFIICFLVMQILFALCFTLSVIEVSQYILFSTARSHMASNVSQTVQIESAREKFKELTTTGAFASLYSGGWFTISKPGDLEIKGGGQEDTFDEEYGKESFRGIPFEGARAKLTAKVLNFQIPFIGRTTDEDDGLSTNVAAFLIREPTQNECQQFMKDRHAAIKNLDPNRFGQLQIKDDSYIPMEDNGC